MIKAFGTLLWQVRVRGSTLTSRALRQFLGFWLSVLFANLAPAQPANAPALTQEEIDWRGEHPVVKVGVMAGDHAPVESWEGGQPTGLGVEYARVLAERVGLRLEFHPFTNLATVASADSSRSAPFDLLLGHGEARQAHFLPLRPFLTGRVMMVARKGDPVFRNGDDLTRARIVIERRFAQQSVELAAHYPVAKLLFADDGRQALDMVAHGEADAYAGITPYRTLALLRRRSRDDVRMLSPLDLPPVRIGLAVRRDNSMLVRLLRKAEATVAPSELTQLRQRWGIQDEAPTAPLAADLSAKERAWLSGLPVLRVGYEVDRFPYSFIDGEGESAGVASDYVEILRKALGLRLQMVPARDWDDLQRMARAYEIDLIAAAMPGDLDESEMAFSRPYERLPEVIVARAHGSSIVSARDLAGRTIAIRDEPGLMRRLRPFVDYGRFLPVVSNESGLTYVAEGRADAFIGTLPAVDALIRNHFPAQLRVVGPVGFEHELSIGVRREHDALLPLMDRVLANLPEAERRTIRARWLATEYRYGVPWGLVLAGLATTLAVIGAITLAYLRLRRASHAQASAERALASQLVFQQALLETIPYPVFVKDTQGRYLSVNQAYETMFNCSRSTLIGQTIAQTRHVLALDSDELHRADMAALETDRNERRELQIPMPNGDAYSVILWLRSFHDPMGEVAGLLGTVVDVSDIRSAEARARSSEQRLSDITEALPAAVFQLHVHPDGRREFTFAAGDLAATIGLTQEQLLMSEPTAFVRLHPDDQPLTERLVQSAADMLQPMPAFDFRVRTEGGWRWLRTAGGVPRRTDDSGAEWSGYWVDVTESHAQAEALAEAKLLADAATAAKGAFLATMSHEIRTPMVGVVSLIELIACTRLDHDQADMVSMAQDSARSLLRILDDILDYSRIESGRVELEDSPFDMRALIDSVIGLFAAGAHEKGLRLYSILDWRLASQLRGDAMRIRQVITNLLSNALKFTDSGHVALHVELIGEHGGRQLLRIAVVDTGIGIAAEHLTHLFQPFTQAEASTTRRYGGTGLGLTISHQLARMMGGELLLESEPALGTRATFELELEVDSPIVPEPAFDGLTAALITVDEWRERELSNALSALGFNVISADADDLAELEADVDLFVVDDLLAESGASPFSSRCIRLIDSPQLHRPVEHGCVTLRCNPQLWHAVLDACQAALRAGASTAIPTKRRPELTHCENILVAEDHPINRSVLARQLDRLGYPYTLVEDGEQALSALAEAQFDLLLTDCHMPNLDGYHLTRRIRASEEPGRQHLPVIALSASTSKEQIAQCREAGMDDFLAKPVQLDTLSDKLATWLGTSHGTRATPKLAEHSPEIGYLLTIYDDPYTVHQLLRDLHDSCRHDLTDLNKAIRTGSIDEQQNLTHRIEGALALLNNASLDDLSLGHDDNPVAQYHRLAQLVDRLEQMLLDLDGLVSS
ncbi:PAS domain S-box-containing protein [Lysobacter niastensis]|uniref:histidine kinase n=1 Tax=Lysobacter niastensis TaxID=380629 RepID=A0ABU1WBP1_9GAMM|nr:transporter substrate-binding domain-containing protein [Lysobacter niastensis]MDR7135003.1 PAS domain S-box-containing protein [Lysobacter niastensis]